MGGELISGSRLGWLTHRQVDAGMCTLSRCLLSGFSVFGLDSSTAA